MPALPGCLRWEAEGGPLGTELMAFCFQVLPDSCCFRSDPHPHPHPPTPLAFQILE